MIFSVGTVALLFAGALGAGFFGALLGIGGGVLKVSAMNRHMNVPMKVAVSLAAFLAERDYAFVWITLFVFLTAVLSLGLGLLGFRA